MLQNVGLPSAGLFRFERNRRRRFLVDRLYCLVKSADNSARYSATHQTHQLLGIVYIGTVIVYNRTCRHPNHVGLKTLA
jgi:hypothetical protein